MSGISPFNFNTFNPTQFNSNVQPFSAQSRLLSAQPALSPSAASFGQAQLAQNDPSQMLTQVMSLLLMLLQQMMGGIPQQSAPTAQAGTAGTAQAGTAGTAQAGTAGSSYIPPTGTAQAGTAGTAQAGTAGTAQAGTAGTAQAGTAGTAHAGTAGTAQAGTAGTAQAGTAGTAQAGTAGTAQAGTAGTAQAGTAGTAQAGTAGTAQAGTAGTAQAGTAGTSQPTAYSYPSVTPPPSSNPPYQAPTTPGGGYGKTWGDPHFVGFDGDDFDVQGEAGKIYNIVSDQNIQVNAQFDKWDNKGSTIMSEMGFQVGKDQVRMDRTGAAPTLNGTAMTANQLAQLDGGSALWDGSKLTVNTPEYKFGVTVDASNKTNGAYLNLESQINDKGPFQDFVAPHGLLGQTADGDGVARQGKKGAGAQGEGAIEGNYTQYQVSNLFGTDFAFNRFGAQVDHSKTQDVNGDGIADKTFSSTGQVLMDTPEGGFKAFKGAKAK